MKFGTLQRKAEDPFLLGPRASGELWIYEEGRASTRRVPCFRRREGASLLGPRAGGELWIYEGTITSPDLGARKSGQTPMPTIAPKTQGTVPWQ